MGHPVTHTCDGISIIHNPRLENACWGRHDCSELGRLPNRWDFDFSCARLRTTLGMGTQSVGPRTVFLPVYSLQTPGNTADILPFGSVCRSLALVLLMGDPVCTEPPPATLTAFTLAPLGKSNGLAWLCEEPGRVSLCLLLGVANGSDDSSVDKGIVSGSVQKMASNLSTTSRSRSG